MSFVNLKLKNKKYVIKYIKLNAKPHYFKVNNIILEHKYHARKLLFKISGSKIKKLKDEI